MAIIYNKKTADTHYQVRTAGQSVRLYSNGVLHSQYNPLRPISGAIWDLLLLPGFFIKEPPQRILLLGLGGGTVLHLIKKFFPQAHVTCVELDPQHIHIAHSFFKIPRQNVEIVCGDAYAFLKTGRDQYDWIIDDVFQHVNGDPERCDGLAQGASYYAQRLGKQGILSFNIIGRAKHLKAIQSSFRQTLQLRHPLYENRIVSFVREKTTAAEFKQRLRAHRALDQSYKTCRLQYQLKTYS